jgi:hypothetical protein
MAVRGYEVPGMPCRMAVRGYEVPGIPFRMAVRGYEVPGIPFRMAVRGYAVPREALPGQSLRTWAVRVATTESPAGPRGEAEHGRHRAVTRRVALGGVSRCTARGCCGWSTARWKGGGARRGGALPPAGERPLTVALARGAANRACVVVRRQAEAEDGGDGPRRDSRRRSPSSSTPERAEPAAAVRLPRAQRRAPRRGSRRRAAPA